MSGTAPVIDVHTHYVPRGWPDLGPGTPWLRVETETDAVIMLGDREFRRIQADCWDAPTRLADMDADGIDAQVVSPTPVFFSYGRDVAQDDKQAIAWYRKAADHGNAHAGYRLGMLLTSVWMCQCDASARKSYQNGAMANAGCWGKVRVRLETTPMRSRPPDDPWNEPISGGWREPDMPM